MLADTQRKGKLAVALVGDIVLGVAAYLLCFYARSVTTFPFGADVIPLIRFQYLPHYWLALIISQAVWLYFLGFYDQLWDLDLREIVFPVLAGVAVQTLFLGSYYGFASQSIFPRTIFPLFWIFNSALIIWWRTLLTSLFHSRALRRVIIVGLNAAAERLIKLIESQPSLRLQIIGLLSVSREPAASAPSADSASTDDAVGTFCDLPVLGTVEDLDRLIVQHKPDEVIVSSGESWQDTLIDRLGRASGPNVRLSLLPSAYEILIGKPRHLRIRDVPLIEVAGNPNPTSRLLIKRTLDVAFASLLLLVLSPVFLFIALYVKLSSKGPAFFAQERVGKGGEVFLVFKFRTMVPNAERESGAILSTQDDPRITSAGRFLRRMRLDELPQLFNVLRGDMSFIGPRPERPVFVAEFARNVPGYVHRHQVKPGITGLAQVNGFYDTDAANKLKYDLYYIHNYSLWLDFLIVIDTLKTVVGRRGR